MSLTKEQRKERARKKMEKLREASKTGNLTDRMDWRPKAKVVFHPDTEIKPRRRIWFPTIVDVKDDEKDGKKSKKGSGKTKVVPVPFNVPFDTEKCPFSLLSKILRERDDIDGEDNIICVGTGRNKVELCKGEILAWKGYDYKKSLKVNNDFVAVAVMIENAKKKRPSNLKAVIFSGAKSLGSDIMKEIESEIDEAGEEDGCPFITPYPFILTYDEDERGTDMYSAKARPQEASDVAEDEKLMKILNEDPPDIESEIELSSIPKMIKAINSSIVYDGLVIEMEGVKEDEKDNETGKSDSKGKSKKSNTKSNSKMKSENPDPEETRKISDKEAEAQAQAELEAEAQAQAEAETEDDSQSEEDAKLEAEALAEIEAEEAAKKKAEEEEAAKKKAKIDAALKAAKKKKTEELADKKAKAEAEAEKKVKEKPKTKKEKKAELIAKKKAEILAKKKAEIEEKKKSEIEEKKEKPKKEKAKKEKAKKEKKKAKTEMEKEVGWEPEADEDYDICPVCKGKVPIDSKKCPHPGCEAIFAPEDGEPF